MSFKLPFKLLPFAAAFAAVFASPASADRYCSGATCDSYVVTPHRPLYHPSTVITPPHVVHRPRLVHRPRVVHRPAVVHPRHVRRTHVPRVHVDSVPSLHPQPGPVHLPGRTRFCSDHVEWHGHSGIRDCIQVRNDLLDRH